VFKQASLFLKELSNDNTYIKCLHSEDLDKALVGFAPTEHNSDFYWNIYEFYFNVVMEKEGVVGIQNRWQFYSQLIGAKMTSQDPVTYFTANFLKEYKLAQNGA